jgi:hypothetical protein
VSATLLRIHIPLRGTDAPVEIALINATLIELDGDLAHFGILLDAIFGLVYLTRATVFCVQTGQLNHRLGIEVLNRSQHFIVLKHAAIKNQSLIFSSEFAPVIGCA